jgi:hypothetical protein
MAKAKAYAAQSGNPDEFVRSEPKLTVLTDHALRHEEVSEAFEHDPFNFRYKLGPVYDILRYKDPRDVQPGVPWAKAVGDAISGSRLMAFILSSQSNDSPQVMREVERAAPVPFQVSLLFNQGLDSSDTSLRVHAVERLACFVRSATDFGVRLEAPQVLRMFRKKEPEAFGARYVDLLKLAALVPGSGCARMLRNEALTELEKVG